jgi:hypothetical protein
MNNYALLIKYRESLVEAECVKKLYNTVTRECRYYLLGKLYLSERKKHPDKLARDIRQNIYNDFNISESTLYRTIAFEKAIEDLHTITPEILPDIIEGRLHISITNIISLSKKTRGEILKITKSLYRPSVTIKDTPEFDPDARVSSLFYTIPSWASVIDNVFMNSDFVKVSSNAKNKLKKELEILVEAAEAVIEIIWETNNG